MNKQKPFDRNPYSIYRYTDYISVLLNIFKSDVFPVNNYFSQKKKNHYFN